MLKTIALSLIFATFAIPQNPPNPPGTDFRRLESVEQFLRDYDPNADVKRMQKQNRILCVNALIDSFRQLQAIEKLYTSPDPTCALPKKN
jgi:hypothetical protein